MDKDKNEDSFRAINYKTVSTKFHTELHNSSFNSFKLSNNSKLKKIFVNYKLFSYQKTSGNVSILMIKIFIIK